MVDPSTGSFSMLATERIGMQRRDFFIAAGAGLGAAVAGCSARAQAMTAWGAGEWGAGAWGGRGGTEGT